MSDFNSRHNRAVWFDIPVADLGRAQAFYAAVLARKVSRVAFGDDEFCVIDHAEGNGGCLVKAAGEIARDGGILVYLNTDGRIRDALAKVTASGGEVLTPLHPIGPHGFRAVIRDSEGNRLALHSTVDA